MVAKNASILLSAQPGDSEYACVSSSAFCVSLVTVFVACDDIGRGEKVLPGSLSGSLGLGPLRFDLFSIWEGHYFLPEL